MKKRIAAGFFVCALIFGGLYSRLLYLSSRPALAATAESQASVTLAVSKTRANIYDCYMNKLVGKTKIPTAAVFPSPENFAAVKAACKGYISSGELLRLYSSGAPFTVSVKENVNAENVTMFSVPQRYRDVQTAAHIIGCVDSDNVGISGIERACNAFLTKHAAWQSISYRVNGAGELLGGEPVKISVSGEAKAGVILTIDSKIQQIAEAAGKQSIKNGAVIVMEPKTGKIKAMASFPAFSQNSLEKSVGDAKNAPMINRALSPFAVGSAFKIVTAAAALESGLPKQRYACTGQISVGEQRFACHEAGGHGALTMKQAMAKSCNTYFIRLGLSLDKLKLRAAASDMSFGKSFELAPGMVSQSGTLPDVSELSNPAETANFSFGQGKLTATPLQVTLMTCCVANGGRLNYPSLIEGTTVNGAEIKKSKVKAPMRVLSEEAAERLREFLKYDVMQTENQYAKPVSTTAGGKTATAQTGVLSGRKEKLNAWFTGYFPADDPQYAVTVLCENGVWGNTSAAPVFQKIADRITALKEYEDAADRAKTGD